MSKFKLDDYVFYNGHICQIICYREFDSFDSRYVIQGCEPHYNKTLTACEEELSSVYMRDPNKQVYKFNLNDWKCVINNGEIVLEKL